MQNATPAKTRLFFDLHVHTKRYSACSQLPPERLIAAARARGLDGLVLTEHDVCWKDSEIEELLEAAGRPRFILLAGCEVRVALDGGKTGDLLVFGADSPPKAGLHIDEVCRQVHGQGGVIIAPHPFASGLGIGDEVYSARIDAIEIHNDRYRASKHWSRAAEAWGQLGITATGGSDAHVLEAVGRCCTEFNTPVNTIADLVGAIRAGQCKASPKPPPVGLWQSLFGRR